ncbi:MAG: PQQ-like beta-propeller repeat protein [Phycisphaerae bacterium]|nr:PQQ-like beta-propeller repeat protein [Phycisphaerae bacterium]
MRAFLVTAVVLTAVATGLVIAQDGGEAAAPLKGVFPTATAAPAVALDGAATILPCYELPADAAADGNLEKWRGVQPAVSAHWFKHNDSNAIMTPSDDFSPALYVGRPKGTNDLMVLVVIQDRCVFGDVSSGWTFADNVELFLDFGRQARLKDNPGATTQPDKYQNPPEHAQIGLLPRTPLAKGTMLHSKHSSRQWNVTYTSTPVSGGIAYEVKVDGKALLEYLNKALLASINKDLAEDAKVEDLPENLTIAALPEIIGIDLAILAVDYPLLLETGAWKNHRGYFRIFGDHTVVGSPVRLGGLSTTPLSPEGDALPGVTLASKFGSDKEELAKQVKDLKETLHERPWSESGELIYWASCNGVVIDKEALLPFTGLGWERELTIAEWVRAQELVAQAMLNPAQDVDARREMVAAIHANLGDDKRAPTHRAIVTANVIATELKCGDPVALGAMLNHEDMTVVVSASKALSAVGEKKQAKDFRAMYDEKVAALAASKRPDDRATLLAMRVFVMPELELLEYRVDPPAEPKTALRREIQQANTDLPRMMPLDNNHVYNGKLLREWPKEGPTKLWELKIGSGVTAAVEVGGKTFAMGGEGEGEEAGTHGYCIDAASGSVIWKQFLNKGRPHWAAAGPVVDGENVYFFTDGGAVVCLKVENGEEVWREDKAYRGPSFSCPLIVGNILYLPGKSLLAIDKADGKVLWTAPEKPEERRDTSPASLAYGEIDGVGVIVMGFGNGADAEVMGLSAATGEVFFRKAIQIGFGLCTSPVIDGSRLYVSSGQPGQEFFVAYQMFVKDGKVNALPMFSRKDTQCNYANTLTVWDGAVYGFSNHQLECSDATTGDRLWATRPHGVHNGSHLLLADGLLLIQASADMVLAEANKTEYRELGRFTVPVPVGEQQHTLANGRLYIRGRDTLVVYDVGAK